MARETVYIVQAYKAGRGKGLKAEQQVGCKDAEELRSREPNARLVVLDAELCVPSDDVTQKRDCEWRKRRVGVVVFCGRHSWQCANKVLLNVRFRRV